MDAIELIIWVLAVLGVLGVNLYKQWQQHREMRRPRPRALAPQPTRTADVPTVSQDHRGRFDEDAWGRVPQREDEPMPLEQLLEQALGTRAEEAREQAKEVPLPPPVHAVREAPVYTPAAQPPRAAPTAAPRTGARRRHPPLFNPHTDLRAAIIGMTVLGPCRALAPYEAPDSGAQRS